MRFIPSIKEILASASFLGMCLSCSTPAATLHSVMPGESEPERGVLGTWIALASDSEGLRPDPDHRLTFTQDRDGALLVQWQGQELAPFVFKARAARIPEGHLVEALATTDPDEFHDLPSWIRSSIIPIRIPYMVRFTGDTMRIDALSNEELAVAVDSLQVDLDLVEVIDRSVALDHGVALQDGIMRAFSVTWAKNDEDLWIRAERVAASP